MRQRINLFLDKVFNHHKTYSRAKVPLKERGTKERKLLYLPKREIRTKSVFYYKSFFVLSSFFSQNLACMPGL